MEIALGFFIALFISLTGVGAGSLTVPLLILVLGLPARECVGTAQIVAAVVKILSVPAYMARKQVNWRVFSYFVATGLPGVFLGALLLKRVPMNLVTGMVGLTIMSIALLNLFRFAHVTRHDRKGWLAVIGFPIGLEMGFTAAGAGAVGALSMMSLTTLAPSEIVGTGLAFGLVLSLAGSGIHLALGTVNLAVLWKLLIGGAAGAMAGSVVSSSIPSRRLRLALCVLLVAIGAQLSWKSFSEMYQSNVAAASAPPSPATAPAKPAADPVTDPPPPAK